jgi:S-adenosylmethionine-diacylglycerol 3-amino-3-carboxypropyl transferase
MNDLYFAQIREDSLVERALVAERAPARIVCIGSGGCTALSLLSDRVEQVLAIDANPAQCALMELKKEAVRGLTRAEYLAFIGEQPSHARLEVHSRLAGRLTPQAREFWDRHAPDIATGINQCGATERFYRFVGANLRRNVCGDEVWRELLDCPDIAAQRALHERHFTTEAWRTAVRVLLSRTTHLQFFPAFMFAQATENDLGAFFAAQFEREVTRSRTFNNYFLSQLVFASYLPDRDEGMPRYLSEEGYAAAKRNIGKLAIVRGALQDVLPRLDGIDAFFLSNVFDWAGPADRSKICEGILAAAGRRAILLYRNMLSAHALPQGFQQRLTIDAEQCKRLCAMERSMLYRQIVAAEIG